MENIKKILDSEAGFLIQKANGRYIERLVDNRFELVKQVVAAVEDKDDGFYFELIKLLSVYIDKLYDSRVEDFPRVVLGRDINLIPQDYCELNRWDMHRLSQANRELSEKLFEYVCEILKNNKDVKLNTYVLTKLLNRSPEQFGLSVEESYTYRVFDFEKLVTIIKCNSTVKKSNISIDAVYQILIDTSQLDNSDVFCGLVRPKDFRKNHNKVKELLTKCSAKSFVRISNIIVRYLDESFDRLSLVKERKEKGFCERVIIELVKIPLSETDCNFVHTLLTDESISIDYDYYYLDYFGQKALKDMLAFSGNKVVIKDLLSRKENIQNVYCIGEAYIQLYRLYAIAGEYEKAIKHFKEHYHYADDFTEDFVDSIISELQAENYEQVMIKLQNGTSDNREITGFNKDDFAHGNITYKDSLVEFIKCICISFKQDDIDYLTLRSLISIIINSDNVKYINLEEVLLLLECVLTNEDFKLLLESLKEKYKVGALGFITVNEQEELYSRYIIKIASNEEVENVFSKFDKQEPDKVFTLENPFKQNI